MKKLIVGAALVCASLVGVASSSFKNGKVILVISLEVKNLVDWKKAFDSGAQVREKAGIKVLSICSSVANENVVTVIEEAENAQAANDFMNTLKALSSAGVFSKMDVKILDKVE